MFRYLAIAATALGLGAAARAPMWHPYYLQIEVAAPETQSGRPSHPVITTCQINRASPLRGVDQIFVESGCRATDHQWLTRWDPTRQRMVSASDIKSSPAFVSPMRLLDLRAWAPIEAFFERPDRSAVGDYEVELSSHGEGLVRSRVTLKSGEWVRYVDVDNKGGQRLTVENRSVGVLLSTSRDTHGRTLGIRGPFPASPFVPPPGPVRLEREPDQRVLNETCVWWDLEPGMSDAGLWECRAADGAPLIVRRIRRGWGEDMFAVNIVRHRVPLSRVLPSKEELSAKSWGLAG